MEREAKRHTDKLDRIANEQKAPSYRLMLILPVH